MSRIYQIFLVLMFALCLLTDTWVLNRFVVHRPVHPVVVGSGPGEAKVKFENTHLGAVDTTVVVIVVLTNVLAALLVWKAFLNVRGKSDKSWKYRDRR